MKNSGTSGRLCGASGRGRFAAVVSPVQMKLVDKQRPVPLRRSLLSAASQIGLHLEKLPRSRNAVFTCPGGVRTSGSSCSEVFEERAHR